MSQVNTSQGPVAQGRQRRLSSLSEFNDPFSNAEVSMAPQQTQESRSRQSPLRSTVRGL